MVQPTMPLITERVVVFVDGSNLYFAIRRGLGEVGRFVDVDKLARKLTGPRNYVRTYYYSTPAPRPDSLAGRNHQKFLHALGWVDLIHVRLGRIVERTSRMECPSCAHGWWHKTHAQKGVDTRIAIDLVTLAVRDTYDTAILVCGDSDLTEAVKFVHESTNKRVENAFVPWQGWATSLREASSKRVQLTKDFLANCWIEAPFEEETPEA